MVLSNRNVQTFELRKNFFSYFVQSDLTLVISSQDKFIDLVFPCFSKSNSSLDFVLLSGLFCCFLVYFQSFPQMRFSHFFELSYGLISGSELERIQHHQSCHLAILLKVNLICRQSLCICSTIHSVWKVLLRYSTTKMHLMKPSQQPGKSWSSAAIKKWFLLLHCDGDNYNIFQFFPQTICFLKWGLKFSQNCIRTPCLRNNALSYFWSLGTVVLVLNFWSWTWTAVDPFTGTFPVLAAIIFFLHFLIWLGSPSYW